MPYRPRIIIHALCLINNTQPYHSFLPVAGRSRSAPQLGLCMYPQFSAPGVKTVVVPDIEPAREDAKRGPLISPSPLLTHERAHHAISSPTS